MKKITNRLVIILLMVILFTTSGIITNAQGETIQTISTVSELMNINNNLSGNYLLSKDIDLTGIQWEPIGTKGKPFTGILDGNGYTISNINIMGNDSYIGLFGSIEGGTIKNLSIENATIHGDSYIGALVGHIKDNYTIDNCHLIGEIFIEGTDQYIGGVIGYGYEGTIKNTTGEVTVRGSNSVGGLIGYNGLATIENTSINGIIQGIGEANIIGGLVGCLYNSEINNSNAQVQIVGQEKIGGLIGYGNVITIKDSYAIQEVTGTNEIGGLVGFGDRAIVIDCHAEGDATGTDKVGGLAGHLDNQGSIENSYAEGNITGNSFVGGLVGFAERYSIKTSYASTNIHVTGSYVGGFIGFMKRQWISVDLENCLALGEIQSQSNGDYIGGLIGYSPGGQIIKNCYSAVQAEEGTMTGGLFGYSDGIICETSYYDGTASNCSPISRYDISRHTQEMRTMTVYNGWDFEQIWTLNEGQSYPYLKNLKIPTKAISELPANVITQGNGTVDQPYEIFTKQQLKHIRYNLEAHYKIQDDIDLIGENWLPIGTKEQPFTGTFNGNGYKISNLFIGSNDSYIGLLGSISSGIVKDLVIENADISGNEYLGTLVGYGTNHYQIENIKLKGTINVKGTNYIGGLIGRGYIGNIKEVSAKVNVEGTKSVGGLVGSVRSGTIEECDIQGTIKGTDSQVGGIAGFLTECTLENSYAIANVEGNLRVGGLVGLFGYLGQGTINNSYAAPQLTGISKIGGLTGSSYNGIIQSSYFDSILANSTLPDEQSKTTEELMKQESFDNWDFDTTWTIEENTDYPKLRELSIPDELEVTETYSRELTLQWYPIKDATGYEIEIDRYTIVQVGNVTTFTHEGLYPGTRHRYRIRAINDNERSNWSTKVIEITLLDTPVNLSTNILTGSSITLSWDVIEGATGYKVEINGEEITVSSNNHIIQPYQSNTEYNYRVKAINDITDSLWSEKLSQIMWEGNNPSVCLSLVNQKTSIDTNEPIIVKLKGHNITDLYTIQLELCYDPSILTFTKEQIQDMIFKDVDTDNKYLNISLDSEKGIIQIMNSLTNNIVGKDGDLDIISLQGDMIGIDLSTLNVKAFKLVDSDGKYINVTIPQDLNIWLLTER